MLAAHRLGEKFRIAKILGQSVTAIAGDEGERNVAGPEQRGDPVGGLAQRTLKYPDSAREAGVPVYGCLKYLK